MISNFCYCCLTRNCRRTQLHKTQFTHNNNSNIMKRHYESIKWYWQIKLVRNKLKGGTYFPKLIDFYADIIMMIIIIDIMQIINKRKLYNSIFNI